MTALAYDYSADELALRLGQQELVAGFGLYALGAAAVGPVLQEACRVAALGLRTEFAKVLRPLPSGELLVIAGVGWRPGVVGHATVGAGGDSAAGYALHTGQPVLSNNLAADGRFGVPPLLADHGVQSAINVPVGAGGAACDVLEVDSTARNGFLAADTAFLQSLGNVLAAALMRQDMDEAAAREQALARQMFEGSPDCIKVMDLQGRLLAMNANGATALGCTGPGERIGTSWPDCWPEEARAAVCNAVEQAARGRASGFAAPIPAKGGETWWDVRVAPVLNGDGRPFRLIAFSRDVTASVEAERAKDDLLRDKDLLMQEVHHRVKNSLQLVRTLLQLQGRSASPETRAQLDEAAGRIMTIGAMHQRLYEGGSVTETDAAAYLGALMDDMRTMLADSASGRTFTLDAEPVLLPADQMTPLGLIVSELMTNAIKYGQGPVRVGLRRVPAGLEVAVEDGGPGFPDSFDPARKTGLGMRLVAALAKGEGAKAIQVDRNVPHGRVVVTITL